MELLARSSKPRFSICPISSGMEPWSLFLPKYSLCNSFSFPKVAGIVPSKWLYGSCRVARPTLKCSFQYYLESLLLYGCSKDWNSRGLSKDFQRKQVNSQKINMSPSAVLDARADITSPSAERDFINDLRFPSIFHLQHQSFTTGQIDHP